MIALLQLIQNELELIIGDNQLEVIAEGDSITISINKKLLIEVQENHLTKEQLEILKSKVRYNLGQAKRIHGRKCKLKKITKPEAENFFNDNHWLGPASSKVNVGAFNEEELLAVCSFATPKKFREDYYSGELIRFANKKNTVVVGGLDKMIKWYLNNYQVNDIMTYVDKKWGNGKAFERLGFLKMHSNNDLSYKYVYATDNVSDK